MKLLDRLPFCGRETHITRGLMVVSMLSCILVGASEVSLSDCDDATLRSAVATGAAIHLLCDGKILLSAPLVISADTLIDGSGHFVTISGQRIGRVFEVDAGAKLALINVTIADGWSTNGGALYNLGTVIVSNCTFTANTAIGVGASPGMPGVDARGGAIFNSGSLTISCSTFFGNNAVGGDGISWLLMNGTAGSAGDGGAIANFGDLTIVNSTITQNVAKGGHGADGFPGGFGPCDSPSVGAINGGDGGNGGDAAGGAIYCSGGATTLTNCTVANNTAAAGAFGSGGPAGACVFFLPFPPYQGGRPGAPGKSGLAGVAQAAGIALLQGSCTIRNTLLAMNRADANVADVFGVFASAGHNFVSATNESSGWVNTDLVGTAGLPLDAKLRNLGSYGGPTFTMRPRADSPAIDRGGPSDLNTDQRGRHRVVVRTISPTQADFDGSDVGAYELEEFRFGSIQTTDAGLALTFPSDPSLVYRVEWTSNLVSGAWSSLSPDVTARADAIQLVDQAGPAMGQRFYRAIILPP